ncbi:hypothetical protein H6P1_00205 (plasmid) [Variovorax sp. PBL-H6]|nr:hypothetical protein H6P1_00205 [Variovorax sp. PBL-H6]VTU43892.1 hypothetical protein SRS16P1_00697 [Variovorax sp. SRS16]VTU43966.1 hypothetical protein E5P1_00690 [Variovorax sp. PBL-E5]
MLHELNFSSFIQTLPKGSTLMSSHLFCSSSCLR